MTARRLGEAALSSLPATVTRPAYDRGSIRIGIVHLGIGAFHRAHQAVYVDDLLVGEPDWAICGVSLRSPDVRDALQPQQGLYTLALLGESTSLRVIGSVKEVLCAAQTPDAVLERLADPRVRLVTLTVTEKGYCLSPEGIDLAHPDIARDLRTPDAPASAVGCVVAGLKRRMARGLPPYTVLSCDNLADNGGRLRRAAVQYAAQFDEALAGWIEDQVAFPRSMVDSITPATDDALRERVRAQSGVTDAWPVQREPYAQWVVEDWFCAGRPAFEKAGVTMSSDIAGYDRAKLRLLNAPHSALAYLGSLLDLDSVADAMRDPELSGFVEALMRAHIVPNLDPPAGFDADGYVDAILARFRNPAIRHRLAQIAWDGSQKIPVRLLGTIADALSAGNPIDALCLPIAGWLHFIRREARAGVALNDPLNDVLSERGLRATGDAHDDVAAFVGIESVFGGMAKDERFVMALERAYASLGDGSKDAVRRALRAVLASPPPLQKGD